MAVFRRGFVDGGVAIMDGLLLISYFNQLWAHGAPLNDAIMQGAEKRVRPMMMTALTAILGLLPAALSKVSGGFSGWLEPEPSRRYRPHTTRRSLSMSRIFSTLRISS